MPWVTFRAWCDLAIRRRREQSVAQQNQQSRYEQLKAWYGEKVAKRRMGLS